MLITETDFGSVSEATHLPINSKVISEKHIFPKGLYPKSKLEMNEIIRVSSEHSSFFVKCINCEISEDEKEAIVIKGF
jgi:hypothetical protein